MVAATDLCRAIGNYDTENIPTDPDEPLVGQIDVDGKSVTYSMAPAPVDQQVAPGETGEQVVRDQYLVWASTLSPSGVEVSSRAICEIHRTPVFQYTVFGNGDLEFAPPEIGLLTTQGPWNHFTGRIFSNKDIYVTPVMGELTLDTSVFHGAGSIYRHRKDNGQISPPGDVQADLNTGELVD